MIARAGIFLLAIFFDLAMCVLFAVGVALVWRGTPFDVIWLLRPDREWLLMPYRLWLGPLFLLFTIPAAAASYGLFRAKPWAQQLAIATFAANGLGDAVQMSLGHFWEGLLGVTIVGLLLLFLTSAAANAAFGITPSPRPGTGN